MASRDINNMRKSDGATSIHFPSRCRAFVVITRVRRGRRRKKEEVRREEKGEGRGEERGERKERERREDGER